MVLCQKTHNKVTMTMSSNFHFLQLCQFPEIHEKLSSSIFMNIFGQNYCTGTQSLFYDRLSFFSFIMTLSEKFNNNIFEFFYLLSLHANGNVNSTVFALSSQDHVKILQWTVALQNEHMRNRFSSFFRLTGYRDSSIKTVSIRTDF